MNTTRRDNLIFLKNSTNIKMNKRTNTFIATIISKGSKGNPLSYKMGKIITYLLIVLLLGLVPGIPGSGISRESRLFFNPEIPGNFCRDSREKLDIDKLRYWEILAKKVLKFVSFKKFCLLYQSEERMYRNWNSWYRRTNLGWNR